MKASQIIKVNFLVLALVGVVFLIHKLRSGTLEQGLASLFGAPAASLAGTGVGVTTSLDWCDTRVHALERPGAPTVEQVKLKWLWRAEPVLELNFVAVEKWFGRFCKVQVERLLPEQYDVANENPAMVVKFIQGEPETLFRTTDGYFRWRQELFRSAEMTEALAQLERLPEHGTRTTR